MLYGIVRKMDYKKFKPIIITLKKNVENSRFKDFKELGVQIINVKLNIGSLKKIRKTVEKFNIDLIHSHGVIPDFLNMCTKFDEHGKISTMHNVPFEDYPLTFGKIIGLGLSQFHALIQRKLTCVACSKTVHDKILSKYQIESTVIYNGVSFPTSLNQKDTRRKQNFHFLYLGNVTLGKNVGFLISSFAKMKNAKFVLDIVGDGDLYQQLKNEYQHFKNINFYGQVYDPEKYLQESDFLVSASLSEGMPMSVIEALSCGLPVILSDIPSHEEIMDQGNFGIIFKNNNYDDFTRSVQKIVTQKINKQDIMNFANKIFSDEVMSSNYQQLYRGKVRERRS